jgi:CheY-like chemotaxis protein
MVDRKPGSLVHDRERLVEGAPEPTDVYERLSHLLASTERGPVFRSRHAPTGVTGQLNAIRLQREPSEADNIKDAPSTETATLTSPALSSRKATRVASVLILEDTTELAEVIQATLERLNMTTVIESHGGKALSHYEAVKPDVVLLDLGLPDMNGWKFLETIKEKYKADLPIVIVITAYGDPANRLVGKLQGVYDYLIKPFTSDEVERVVTGALKSRTS